MSSQIDLDHLREPVRQMLSDTETCLNCGRRLRYLTNGVQRTRAIKRNQGYCCAACYFAKPPQMAYVEREFGKPIRDAIVDVLNSSSTNVVAAQLLGVSRFTMYQWIAKLGISKVTEYR